MKQNKKLIAVLLALVLTLTSLAFGTPAASADVQKKSASPLFGAKFEGDRVAGTAELVDGVYRIAATRTDGEAWHIKLESNYPTVTGHEYRITYRFRSDVAGTVKFGDLQEFKIVKGNNKLTGLVIAQDGTSYLDLQLGALQPFTIDFSEIEVVEVQDNVIYEDLLSGPLELDGDDVIEEHHDPEYGPLLMRDGDTVTVNYYPVSHDPAVWKARLYIRTGVTPEPGIRYRVSAELRCDEDMDYEVLLNRDEQEKGYGALYGRHLTGGQAETVEQILMLPESGFADGELVLQFSLGCAPEDTDVTVSNVRVEKVVDKYTNQLPAGFTLNKQIFNGKTYTVVEATDHRDVPLTQFSYSGTDTVFERHDDGYVVNLKEAADSATLSITKAPAEGRGVWKVKLYADTGVNLEAGSSYRICYDLVSTGNQAEYEACFDGDYENAYGALYGRRLTAGGTDHVERIVTPDVSHGPLTLRLQLGNTDSTAGNTFTLKNLSVEKVTPVYQSAGEVAYSTGTDGNVWEEHSDGVEQTAAASGTSATLTTSAARDGGGVWSSRLFVRTGVTPEPNTKYRVTLTMNAAKAIDDFEIVCDKGGAENGYGDGKRTGLSVPAGADTQFSTEFTAPADGCEELTLRFQLGNTPADNTITVSDIQIRKVLGGGEWTDLELNSFAYPIGTAESTENNSFELEASNSAAATLTGDGQSATATINTSTGKDWHIKLYAKPDVVLEAGESYTVSLHVAGANGCQVCFKDLNGGENAETAYGSEILGSDDQTITKTITGSGGKLEILVKLGTLSSGAAATISDVQLKKVTTDFIPVTLSNLVYPTVTPGNTTPGSFALGCEPGTAAAATLSGDGSSATATVDTSTGENWHIKFYAKPGLALENGKQYQVSVNVAGANGCQICFKDLSAGGDAEVAYGSEFISSNDQLVTRTITGSGGVMEILVKIGNLTAGSEVTMSGIAISESTTVPEDVTPSTVKYLLDPPGEGAEATQNGNSATVITPTPADDWKIKFYAQPGMALENGKQYRVSFNVAGANGCQVCFKDLNGGEDAETAYGSETLSSDDQTITKTITGSGGVLEIMVKLGALPANSVVTLGAVTIEEFKTSFAPVELSGFTYPVTVKPSVTKNSFDVGCQPGTAAAATLSGDGSSATATVDTSTGENWHIKFYAMPGEVLENGKKYQVSLHVAGASGCQVCFKDLSAGEDAETAYGSETLSSNDQTVTKTITGSGGVLEILVKIGNLPAGSQVTISGVSLSEFKTGEVSDLPDTFKYPVTTPGSLEKKSFDLGCEPGTAAAATLSGDGSSATATVDTSTGENWHIKFYAMPGEVLENGKQYRASLHVAGANGCQVCFKDLSAGEDAETAYGIETLSSDDQTLTKEITGTGGKLEILVKIGTLPVGAQVTITDVALQESSGETLGENLMTNELKTATVGNVNFWAHEDYTATLSDDGSSATLAVLKAPASGREFWKVKLFVETGIKLEAGKHYRIRADVSADADTYYEICYNNGAVEKGVGALYDLYASSSAQTAEFETTTESAADLILQFNFGRAAAPTAFTVSKVTVEEMTDAAAENVLPSFRYDSVGSFSTASDDGYIVSLDKAESSAKLTIHQAPAVRDPWRVKFNVNTGFTPAPGQAYVVSFDVEAAKYQGSFEVFYDGDSEAAYGEAYGLNLSSGKNSFSQIIYPDKGSGVLSLQLRVGNTNGTDGNTYTVSNVKVQSVRLEYNKFLENEETASLRTEGGYSATLSRLTQTASVRLFQSPKGHQEAWKTKLFIPTGVKLRTGQKYRVSFEVFSNADAPYELCLNRDGIEKGFGARYGMTATYTPQVVEYIFYASQDGYLELQFSLGNATAPCTFTVSSVRVEKAAGTSKVSDTIYTF